jgi:hypothetical protein
MIDACRNGATHRLLRSDPPNGGIRQRLMADFREWWATVAIGLTSNFGKTRSNRHLSGRVGVRNR